LNLPPSALRLLSPCPFLFTLIPIHITGTSFQDHRRPISSPQRCKSPPHPFATIYSYSDCTSSTLICSCYSSTFGSQARRLTRESLFCLYRDCIQCNRLYGGLCPRPKNCLWAQHTSWILYDRTTATLLPVPFAHKTSFTQSSSSKS
jgi:hypothetical protein